MNIAEKQIVLAGHRLANLLKSLKLDTFDVHHYVEEEEIVHFLNDPEVQDLYKQTKKEVLTLKDKAKHAFHSLKNMFHKHMHW